METLTALSAAIASRVRSKNAPAARHGVDKETGRALLSSHDVQALSHFVEPALRDLASCLLAGDPFEANEVCDQVLSDLVGADASLLRRPRRLERTLREAVVEQCLIRAGNDEVADWWKYLEEHRDEKPKKKSAPAAAGEATRRWRPAHAATRRARQALRPASTAPTDASPPSAEEVSITA